VRGAAWLAVLLLLLLLLRGDPAALGPRCHCLDVELAVRVDLHPVK
jgi:hypothetical protein